ncbi:MAG: response regulator receiver modulated metal dependent phosphohydrolase [Rhodocyclales bacterium]|nr:response regulator receiver modulated metal dependent phosphohydrolase [Rhodocyclales bacterium]
MTDVAATSPTSAQSATNWPPGYTNAPVVMLVDDETNVLNALRRLLRPVGYTVLTANGGAEALSLLAAQEVDLLVSDMRMPEMDGAQLLAQARQRWPDTQRVLLTGYADVTSAVSAINEGGIFRYVSKPWDEHEFLSIIHQALSWRGLQREKLRLEALTFKQNEELKSLNASLEAKVAERTADLQIANQELTLANEKLQKTFFNTVQVMSSLIELRAPQLAGHSRRVADVARRIAEKMGLNSAAIHEVLMAGLLHDIGKIGYGDQLLATPMAKMTAEGLSQARKHPLNGAAALMSLPDMRGVAAVIRSHHERWDGTGFPDGLKGEAIPLGARILALANDYDAVQIGTLSVKKHNSDEAKQYVIEGRSFRYDPAVCDAFSELIGRARAKPVAEIRVNGAQAKPGMVLTRDLFSHEGVLLLAVEHVLDNVLIKQVREYEETNGKALIICVKA